ncbi:molybdopterin-dependent oxidoreductase [Thiocystis violacea]|uniref:molybdopterin-dependent oxidoreductase n=1 Tax=Thiocystis violacea TaxID=13725 RepID=UPI0019047B51|nr:molybdopterin-dependent oxidoreductase [Thiocystis violacea]MBK1718703.1 hypothetical protein [Thiocystis violacea]
MMSLLKQPLFVIALVGLSLAALSREDAPPPKACPVETQASAPAKASAPPSSLQALLAPKRSAVSESLSITGAVVHPKTLSVADLERFPPHRIAEVEMICEFGANLGKRENLRGVLLRDLLLDAQLKGLTPKHFRKMAIIAHATDGYLAVFSWAELFNSTVGAQVIVYFSKDGRPLDDTEGRIALISTTDSRTGPRHVRWLNAVEVRSLGD